MAKIASHVQILVRPVQAPQSVNLVKVDLDYKATGVILAQLELFSQDNHVWHAQTLVKPALVLLFARLV